MPGAGDNFHRDCVTAFDLVPQELLDGLISRGVLRGYQLSDSAK